MQEEWRMCSLEIAFNREKETNNETKQRCYAVSIFFENVLITGDSEMANRQINEGIFKGRAC